MVSEIWESPGSTDGRRVEINKLIRVREAIGVANANLAMPSAVCDEFEW
jgi:hypothetical protein